MNRDSTVIQAAILLIIIAILGAAIIKKQQQTPDNIPTQPTVTIENDTNDTSETEQPTPSPTGETQTVTGDEGTADTGATTSTGVDETEPAQEDQPLVEQPNSQYASIVRAYFQAIGREDYTAACELMSSGQCNVANPAIVENFSNEFEKLVDGYDYINVKDYGIVAPSGKHVVCVKYTYRYIDDTNQAPISEIMSFYLDEINGTTKITNRVCEKKYKEGWGVRPCPIQANAEFCEGNVK